MPEILATLDLRQRYHEAFVAPMIKAGQIHIQKRVAQQDIRAVNAEETASLIYALFFGLLCLRILGDERLQPSEAVGEHLVEAIKQLFLTGLSTA